MTTRRLRNKAHEKEISLRYLFLAAIFWILTITWIIVIYFLSNQNSNDSSSMSHMIMNIINELLNTNVEDDSSIRMVAHSSEFALLTVLSYIALSSTNRISSRTSYAESPVKLMRSDNEMNIIFTLWFSVINAIVDEYHQLFIKGRDGTILDVLIDLIGIVIVLILIRVIFTIYLKTKGKTEVVYT